jgi:hypothetical protein
MDDVAHRHDAGIISPPGWHADRRRVSASLARSLWGIAFVAAWAALTLIYTSSLDRKWDLISNSDLLMPFMVMRDMFRNPASIMTWELSPAIYVFPDWIVAGVLQASPLPRKTLPFVYGGFLLTAYGLCIGWMMKEMRTADRPEAMLWGTTLIAAVFLANNVTRLGFGGMFIKCICAPYIHSGGLFAGLILIPLLMQRFHGEGDERRRSAIASLVLVGLACYSDPIFVLWFAAPVCLAYLVTPTRISLFYKARAVAGLAAVGGAAMAIDRWLRPGNVMVTVQSTDVLQAIEVWRLLLSSSIAQSQWQLWLPVMLTFVMLCRGAWLTRAQRGGVYARGDSVEVAIIFATVSSLVLPVLMGVMIHPSLLRYSLPVVFLPYVWLLAWCSRRFTPRARSRLSLATLGFWLGCTILLPQGVAGITRLQQAETLSGTLTSLGQRAGYGDYWTCKRTMFETDYAVHCVQLDTVGRQSHFNYNSAWFKSRADDDGEILPTFIVMSRLDEAAIRGLFGDPDTIAQFRGDNGVDESIWLYDDPLPLIKPAAMKAATSPAFATLKKNRLEGDLIGIGTGNPISTLHVARRDHPDLLTLQNLSERGGSWLLQVGGNGWQDGNLMISHRPSGKYSLVMEPSGKVVVMGDMHVAGTLTTAQPGDQPRKDVAAPALRETVEALTAIVEELLGRVGDLELQLEERSGRSP